MKGLSVTSAATQVTPGSDAENDDRWDIDPIPLPLCPYASGLTLPSQGLEEKICLRRIGKSGTHRKTKTVIELPVVLRPATPKEWPFGTMERRVQSAK